MYIRKHLAPLEAGPLTGLAAVVVASIFTLTPTVAGASTPLSTENQVREHFWDIPVMIAIAKCESEFTQFNALGTVLQGGYKNRMIGLYQIAPLHIPDATALGLNVKTTEGNMAFARHLYEQSGTRPWLASKWCWQHLPEAKMTLDNAAKIAMIQKKIESIKAALAELQ